MANERSSGDLSRSFVGGTAQVVDQGLNARDGKIWLFVSTDWEDVPLDIGPFKVGKGNTIPVHCEVAENLLMCTCVIVMQGQQCAPLHLALVAHCREWLWSKTRVEMSQREVETGSGHSVVDYINIMWAIDTSVRLYRNVTSAVGLCDDDGWDAFWYIYRRGETTPAYSHIGLDTSATLNNQKHVGDSIRAAIVRAAELDAAMPSKRLSRSASGGSFIGRLFSFGRKQ